MSGEVSKHHKGDTAERFCISDASSVH